MKSSHGRPETIMHSTACYQLGRKYLVLGVMCLAFFLAMDVGSVYVAYWNIDSSFKRPTLAALIFGVFWSCWGLLALWMIIAYFRERLFVAPDAITQFGCIGRKSIMRPEVTRIEWKRFPGGGSVNVRSRACKIKVYLSNFAGDEQEQIIAYFRNTFSADIQVDWTRFIESRLQATAHRKPRKTRAAGVVCTLILFASAVGFGYCWLTGLGIQWLVVGVLNALAGVWYVWRLINWQDANPSRPPA